MSVYRNAKSLLVFTYPFFATLMMNMREEITDTLPDGSANETMATNGKTLWVNPEFAESLTLEECTGVLIHEMMHVAFGHSIRLTELMQGDSIKGSSEVFLLWNIATDFAINLQLRDKEQGVKLPAGVLYDPQWEGHTAEEIFHKLRRDPNAKAAAGGARPMGTVLPSPVSGSMEADLAGARMDLRSQLVQAATTAKQMGKFPASMEALIHELVTPRADWRDLLWEFIASARQVGYDWSRPNRRYTFAPITMPSRGAKGIPSLNMILDTSGSVSNDMLTQFLSEARAAVETYDIEDALLVQCDAAVHSVTPIGASDPIIRRVTGRGGTNMNPAFDHLRPLRPAPTILLSDMHIPPVQPFPYPVLWCRNGTGVAWGKGTHIDIN